MANTVRAYRTAAAVREFFSGFSRWYSLREGMAAFEMERLRHADGAERKIELTARIIRWGSAGQILDVLESNIAPRELHTALAQALVRKFYLELEGLRYSPAHAEDRTSTDLISAHFHRYVKDMVGRTRQLQTKLDPNAAMVVLPIVVVQHQFMAERRRESMM